MIDPTPAPFEDCLIMAEHTGEILQFCQAPKVWITRLLKFGSSDGMVPPPMTVLTPREVKSGFARRLRLLHKTLGFRFAREFAEYTGIPVETMYKYLRGQNMPVPAKSELQLIRGLTGATTDWLLYGDERTLPVELRMALSKYERRDARGGGGG